MYLGQLCTSDRLQVAGPGVGPGQARRDQGQQQNSKTGCARLWLGPGRSQGYVSLNTTWQTTARPLVLPRITWIGGESELHSTQQTYSERATIFELIIKKYVELVCNVLSLLTPSCYWGTDISVFLGASAHIRYSQRLPHSCFISRCDVCSCHHIRPSLSLSCRRRFLSPSLPAPSLSSLSAGLGFPPPLFLSGTNQLGARREGQPGHWIWLIPAIVSH